jgi:2-polyprenyl-6-methoxyphenol hydroxylase-like FAD-dependent oxidoreductase
MNSVDVLIIGAGPAGLMAALLLQRQNVSFRIVDALEGPVNESRALGIQARTLELFRALDLDRKVLDAGIKSEGVQLYLRGQLKLEVDISDMARPDTPFPYFFLLSQAKTERILIKELEDRGVKIERRTRLLSFVQEAHATAARIETPLGVEVVRSKFIVGCDGAHSSVRHLLGLEFRGEAYRNEFLMSDAKMEGPIPQNKLCVFLDPGRIGVSFPSMRNGLSRVLTVRRTQAVSNDEATTGSPATLEEVQTNFNEASHLHTRLSDPEWVTRYYVHHRSVDQMSLGRVFLAGDAAHIHSPVGAQGMNTGLQDAANLAWKLGAVVRKEAPETLLDTYHTERWPIGQKLLKLTDRLFSAANTIHPFYLGLRDFLLPLATRALMKHPAGKRWIFRFISQLAIRYHPSAAVAERVSPNADDRFRKTLPAGARAPNARLDEKTEIFDLLKGYGFKLLVLRREALTEKEFKRLIKVWSEAKRYPKFPLEQIWITQEPSACPKIWRAQTSEVFERFGVKKEGVFLIRPDGYIGFRADQIEHAFKRLRVDAPVKESMQFSRKAFP